MGLWMGSSNESRKGNPLPWLGKEQSVRQHLNIWKLFFAVLCFLQFHNAIKTFYVQSWGLWLGSTTEKGEKGKLYCLLFSCDINSFSLCSILTWQGWNPPTKLINKYMTTQAGVQADTGLQHVLEHKCNVLKFDLRDNLVSLDQITCLVGASTETAEAKTSFLWLALKAWVN